MSSQLIGLKNGYKCENIVTCFAKRYCMINPCVDKAKAVYEALSKVGRQWKSATIFQKWTSDKLKERAL